MATAAALVLHAVLLGGLPEFNLGATDTTAAPAAGAAPLLVRQMVWTRQPQTSARAEAAAPQSTPPPTPAPPATPPRVAAAPSATAADAAASAAERLPAAPADAALAAATPAASAVVAPEVPAAAPLASPAVEAGSTTTTTTASSPAEAGNATPPPHYRTQPAPAATLLFDLKRGLAGGQAVLQWRPEGAPNTHRYSLTLQAQAFGISVAAWNSTGHFDAAGLAPDRYAESRRSREVRATNFQRAADKISFSAQANEFPLPAGVQDRSSWMLQLGAILQAQPELAQPGAQVALVVVGTRGAPEPWLFTVQSRAALTLGTADATASVADAVHLTREPRRPYDTRVSVWLDPARHHLPVKVQMLVPATGEGQEFELRQMTLP